MSFTTLTAHLPDGNNVSYMDSGPVKGVPMYTTLVTIHGTAFDSHTFDHLHALAPNYNLRLITVQRRGYAGTTTYTETELQDLRDGNRAFLDRLTTLIGHVLFHIIRTHNIPEPNAERSEGGIVLMGWSMGCGTALSFLSDSALFGRGEYETLRRFTTKVVFYDPAFTTLGLEPIGGRGQGPLMLGKNFTEHYDVFKRLVSSYFDNPDNWDGDPNKLDSRLITDRVTTDSWTEDQWDNIYHPTIAARCDYPMASDTMQPTVYDMTQRAFFDEDMVKSTFPELTVVYFVCWKSPKVAIWAYHQMQLECKKRVDNGQFVRPLNFKVMKDVNHFWHWDYPDDFLKTVADAVRGK